jgi:hypothetical protein
MRNAGSRSGIERSQSLESPVHRKDARRVRGEAASEKARITPIRDLAAQPTLPGVTTCQGGRESRLQGEVAQVIRTLKVRRDAKCRAPKRC